MKTKQTCKRHGWLRKAGSNLLFCVLFTAVFVYVQYVLLLKYEPKDCWPQRYADYAAEPAGGVDVVFLGTSQTYWGVSPMILWNEAGITSINMSGIMHQHTIVYEQLKLLLELNAPPKYMVFVPTSLVQLYTADSEKLLPVYEQFIYTLPTWKSRISAFGAMLREAQGTFDVTSFLMPLHRYHSRWNELTSEDFRLPSDYAREYQPFLKGQMPMMDGINITDFVLAEEPVTEEFELIEESKQGWLKIFELCRQNGVEPLALILPRYDGLLLGTPLEAVLEFLDENGVGYLNYMDEVEKMELDWNFHRHFKDREHLNFNGSLHLSYDLADRITWIADLEDHRDDPAYEQWNRDRDQFFLTYEERIRDMLGDDYYEETMGE